ncbi:L-threonylcarbamoyladenylate synthase [Fervidobacterium thailandense]|uniref:Threonylcarbamoyl-AMP synthase n=1 Tax=Fervidobacterium thailandense TaxID=1008305 RepID=A0A1E3G4V1_9BACT|nr:L-threonylcarbamoyladenylate synthase [Fervidobacterium thailandense]ODN31160.1 translation factor Sua5 [Fervidobacterium thailandense]
METLILKLEDFYKDDISLACEILKTGGLVAFPTETVYGLGALAFLPEAVKKIFAVKGRPADNPLIVHVGSFEQFEKVCYVEEKYWPVVKKVLPGPITFVFRKRPNVPYEVTGGLDTIGVRYPAHPVAQRLALCAGLIAAPSANLSGKPSPTTFEAVYEDLFGKIECIIDGGESAFGIESTIVDLTGEIPLVLRPGPITVEELEELFGKVKVFNPEEASRPLSPGMKYRHYAPDKPLRLVLPEELPHFSNTNVLVLCTEESREKYLKQASNVHVIGSLERPYTIAQNLYKSLRYVDKSPYPSAVIEKLPEYGIFFSIMNRIKKAARGER